MPDRSGTTTRILLVEDNALLAVTLREILVGLGYAVLGPAATVEEALSFVTQGACDAAILDLNLRGSDTLPVARALQQRDCPFLFATGQNVAEDLDGWSHVPVLTKPIFKRELEEGIRALLRVGRSETES